MRHGDKVNNLGRKKAHREALLANLASQLIVHKRIVTTLAKAKVLRTYVEPLITKTKKVENELQISHQHRVVFSYLQDKAAVKELFTVIAPKVAGRPGGYTRIIKLGIRVGDNAETALIELVDFNEIYGNNVVKAAEPAKKTRRAGGSRKKAAASEEAAPEVAPAEESNTEEKAAE
ncbi:50S ribosomal protein L17 [Filimonas effusa]|uniref:Large ribosomal subunit protein bL17 n=1 Tax=Filimonas effusa TaxID=2508721 RepID=A0A4V1MAQ0_9BACT|nr:50S ribosomal protein L17 [Filimonas effusa]